MGRRRSRSRIRLVLLEVIAAIGAIVNHLPLRRSALILRIGILDGVQHGVEDMRPDDNVAASDLGHGLLRRVLPFQLFSFGLFRLRPVPLENAVAEPFLLGSLQRG